MTVGLAQSAGEMGGDGGGGGGGDRIGDGGLGGGGDGGNGGGGDGGGGDGGGGGEGGGGEAGQTLRFANTHSWFQDCAKFPIPFKFPEYACAVLLMLFLAACTRFDCTCCFALLRNGHGVRSRLRQGLPTFKSAFSLDLPFPSFCGMLTEYLHQVLRDFIRCT